MLLALMCASLACATASTNPPEPCQSIASVAPAPPPSTAPHGEVESTLPVADPIFGFSKRALGLERRVEMLQWQRDAQGAYVSRWSAAQIDSSGFDKQHANPANLPFNGERWWTRDARLDGQPVSPDLLAALDAWQPYAPNLSQLPPNLAASFGFDHDGLENGGPDGGGRDGSWLSSSQDPKHPAVGDVRLRWRILERASPPAGVALRDGRWDLAVTGVAATPKSALAPSAIANQTWIQRIFGAHLALLAIVGVVLAILLLLFVRRHR